MVTFTRTCDRCGRILEKDDQLWMASLSLRYLGPGCEHVQDCSEQLVGPQICRPCALATGLLAYRPSPADPIGPEPHSGKKTLDEWVECFAEKVATIIEERQ